MENINWTSVEVVAAIISGIFTFLATIVAAICAAIIGKQITGRKQLLEKLRVAVGDIAFLLAVEEEHGKIHQMTDQETYKQRVRAEATSRGLAWSGRFTPGRAKNLLINDGE